jgi:hypothetical protein
MGVGTIMVMFFSLIDIKIYMIKNLAENFSRNCVEKIVDNNF